MSCTSLESRHMVKVLRKKCMFVSVHNDIGTFWSSICRIFRNNESQLTITVQFSGPFTWKPSEIFALFMLKNRFKARR